MSRPTLPLDSVTRDLIDFCLNLQTLAGFVAEYERQYVAIKYSTRKKKGLKGAAYESTEQLYCQLLNRGRRYPDRENFVRALSDFRKRSNRRVK